MDYLVSFVEWMLCCYLKYIIFFVLLVIWFMIVFVGIGYIVFFMLLVIIEVVKE